MLLILELLGIALLLSIPLLQHPFSLVPAVTAVEGQSGAQSSRGACRLEYPFFVVIKLLLLPQHPCMEKPAVL